MLMIGLKASSIPESVNPLNTNIKILNELNRSPSHPPTGRKNVAMAIKPAVRSPASTLSNPKLDTRKLGK